MRKILSLMLLFVCFLTPMRGSCAGTEFFWNDDLTVLGTDGMWGNANVEMNGFSMFGKTGAVQRIIEGMNGSVGIAGGLQVEGTIYGSSLTLRNQLYVYPSAVPIMAVDQNTRILVQNTSTGLFEYQSLKNVLTGGIYNTSGTLVQIGMDGKLPEVDGSKLTNLTASQFVAANLQAGALGPGVIASSIAVNGVYTAALQPGAVTDQKVTLSTGAISSGKFGDDRVAISTLAVSGGVYNTAGTLVQVGTDGKLPALDGSKLTNLTASAVAAGNIQAGELGTGVIASSLAINSIHTAAIQSGAVIDSKVTLSTAAISSGKFGDGFVAITTAAMTGGFNGGTQLVQLDVAGNLPALNGSSLTALNASNLAVGTVSDTRLSANVEQLDANQTITGIKTFSSSMTVSGNAFSVGQSTLVVVGGNVGVGTTAPGAKLEVNGQVKITGGEPGTNKVLTSDAGGLATWQVAPSTFSIGDSFGGGKIFWIDPTGKQVLIVAPGDLSGYIKWSNDLTATGATADGIYAGKANTVMITSSQHAGSYAAQLCADYNVTADGEYYDDWYLPSTAELLLMRAQRGTVGVGDNWYWSSTEYGTDTNSAQGVDFQFGGWGAVNKLLNFYVRCIRAGPSTSIGNLPTNAETVTNGAYLVSTQTFTGSNSFKDLTAISLTASSITVAGIGINTAQVRLASTANIVISSEVSIALGAGVRVSTNIYIVGFSSAGKYYGDGSNITGVTASAVAADKIQAGIIGSGVQLPAAQVIAGMLDTGVIASSVAVNSIHTAALKDGAVTTEKLSANAVIDSKVLLSTGAISSGKFGDDRVAISTLAISGGVYNTAGRLVQMGTDGKLPALDGSKLSNLTASAVSAANIQAGELGAGVIASSVAVNTIHTAAIQTGAVTDSKVTLSTAAISSGKFGDNFVAITTAAMTGGFNGGTQLVQLDGAGNLPALNGSALTALNASNLASGTVNDARLSANIDKLDANQTLTGIKTFSSSMTVAGNAFSVAQSTLVVVGGNVGIGTSTPQGLLQVGAGSTPGLLVTSGGNIGIGTTNPTSDLHISKYTGSDLGIQIDHAGYSSTILSLFTDYNNVMLQAKANTGGDVHNQGIIFNTGNGSVAERMRITYGGYIGVGTSEPVSKFDVIDGSITVRGTNAALVLQDANRVISPEATAALGGGVRVSTNVYIIGFSSASKYFGDGTGITGVTATAIAAANVQAGTLGSGVIASSVAVNGIYTAAIQAGAVTDQKVTLSTSAVSSGKFGDDRVAISTLAISAGVYNTSGSLVQLDLNGKLPGLDGSALTALNASSMNGTISDARLSSNVDLLAATQTITGSKTFTGLNTFSAITVDSLYATTAAITGNNGIYGLTVSSNVSIAGALYTANGNIGVGTTVPGAKLEVNGQIKITGGTPASGSVLASDGSGLGVWQNIAAAGIGDNLGNHTATTTLNMSGNQIVNMSTMVVTGLNGGIVLSPYVDTTKNYSGGIAIGSGTYGNYSNGVGVGYNAYNNYNSGVGVGEAASNNKNSGVGVGNGASSNSSYGVGVGYNASNNNNSGVGVGNNANNNINYAVGIGAHSQNNQTYGSALGAYSYAASSSTALGSYAKANAQQSVAIGNGTINNSTGTASFGNYAVNTSSDLLVSGNIGIGTTSPGAKLEVSGQIKITGGSPASGSVLSSDSSGLAVWQNIASAGIGDNLGSHVATTTLNMSGKQIINVSTMAFAGLDGGIVLSPYVDAAKNYAYSSGIAIGSAAYNNYNWGVGVGWSAYNNHDEGVGMGSSAYNNYMSGVGVGDSASNNHDEGVGVGAGATANFDSGVGVGWNANSNHDNGVGVGASAANNYNYGVGMGANAGGNADYAVGIGAYSQNNQTYGSALGAYSHAASYSTALGSNAKANAQQSVAIGNGTVNDSTGTASFGNYAVNTSSDLVVSGNIGIGTTAPGAKLEVNGQIKITGGSPASGSVLASDGSGLAVWKNISSAGIGDNLGNHVATTTLNMAGNQVVNVSTIVFTGSDGGIVLSPYVDATQNYAYTQGIAIGSAAYGNYSDGVGLGNGASSNHDYGVGVGAFAQNNYNQGVGVGYNANGNYDSGVGVGVFTSNNYTDGVGVGFQAGGNFNHGVGVGASASGNHDFGVGLGEGASSNHDYGMGAGVGANNNYNSGVGVGAYAYNNPNYAVGIGAYSQNNQTFGSALGAYSYAASSSTALGSYAKANAIQSVAIGNGTVNNIIGTASFGSYAVNTSSNLLVSGNVGIGTTAPGAKLEVNGQIKITGGSPASGSVLSSDGSGLAVWQNIALAGIGDNLGNHVATTTLDMSGNQVVNVSTIAFTGLDGGIVLSPSINPVLNYAYTGGVAIGVNAYSNYSRGVGVGYNAYNNHDGVGVGNSAYANYNSGVGVGPAASGNYSNGVGFGNSASGNSNYGVGVGASASGNRDYAVGIGAYSSGTKTFGSALGAYSYAASSSTALGSYAKAYAQQSVAIGNGTINNSTGTASFGNYAVNISSDLLVSGNVGIGTTAPGAKLEVGGQVKITGGSPGAGKVLASDASGLAIWQNIASAGIGDNLGSHIATTTLNMSGNQILNVSTVAFTGLDGGIVLSPYLDTTQNYAYSGGIAIGSGSYHNNNNGVGVGVRAVFNSNSGVGVGDNASINNNSGVGVGNNASENNDSGVGVGHNAYSNYSNGVGIGFNAYNNYNNGVGVGANASANYESGVGVGDHATANNNSGVGVGFSASQNHDNGVGVGANASFNHNYGVGVGDSADNNYIDGVGVGVGASQNHDYGVGVGASASGNYNSGVGVGDSASDNYESGVGVGDSADDNHDSGVGVGFNANYNSNYGIGVGANASNNGNFAVGIGAYSQYNNPYGSALGAYSYAASSSTALGSYAKANAVRSIAIGNGTVNNSAGTASFGNYAINTSSNLFVSGNVGIGTTSPGAKLEVSGQIKITGGNPTSGSVLSSDGSGLAVWQNIASAGIGDNLGSHVATTTLNMSGKQIINVSTIVFSGLDGGIVLTTNINSAQNYADGSGIAIGYMTYFNYNYGLGVGDTAMSNHDNGVGVGRSASNNLNYGVGVGMNAHENHDDGVGVGAYAASNYNSGVGVGMFASDNNNYGVGVGAYAYYNDTYAVGIGAYSQNNQTFGSALGAYSYAASSSTALGSNAKANAQQSVAIGNGTVNNSTGTASFGNYAVNTSSDLFVLGNVGVGTTAPTANLHISSITASVTQDMLKITTGTASDVFVVKGSGNVGIGTTSPIYKADIYGDARVQGQGIFTGTMTVLGANGLYGMTVSSNVALAGVLYTGFGNVGIGTAAPGSKLEVNGQIKITGGSPGSGKVLVSDSSGLATWQTGIIDNLGNHTATTTLNMSGNQIINAQWCLPDWLAA